MLTGKDPEPSPTRETHPTATRSTWVTMRKSRLPRRDDPWFDVLGGGEGVRRKKKKSTVNGTSKRKRRYWHSSLRTSVTWRSTLSRTRTVFLVDNLVSSVAVRRRLRRDIEGRRSPPLEWRNVRREGVEGAYDLGQTSGVSFGSRQRASPLRKGPLVSLTTRTGILPG